MSSSSQTIPIHVTYHLLYENAEVGSNGKEGSNLSLARMQAGHDLLNADMNAQNADIVEVPSTGKYASFAGDIASANVKMMPETLTEDNIKRVESSALFAQDGAVGYIREFTKKSSQVEGTLDVYLYSTRISNQTGYAGFAHLGSTMACFVWESFGDIDTYPQQRGVPTHEVMHALSLEHTFGNSVGRSCYSGAADDLTPAKFDNFPNDRYKSPCKYDEVTRTYSGLCTNQDVDLQIGFQTRSCVPLNTGEFENFTNFMDYSQFRRMMTRDQAARIRAYLDRNLDAFSGDKTLTIPMSGGGTSPTPTPPIVESGPPGTPIRFLQPYRLKHVSSNLYLGVDSAGSNSEGIWVAATDARVATITVKETAVVYNDEPQLQDFSLCEILDFTTGLVLSEQPASSGNPMRFVTKAEAANSLMIVLGGFPQGTTLVLDRALQLTAVTRKRWLSNVSSRALLSATGGGSQQQTFAFESAPPLVLPTFPDFAGYSPFQVAGEARRVTLNQGYRLVELASGQELLLPATVNSPASWVSASSGGGTDLLVKSTKDTTTPQLEVMTSASIELSVVGSPISGPPKPVKIGAEPSLQIVKGEATDPAAAWTVEAASPGSPLTLNTPLRLRAKALGGSMYLGRFTTTARVDVDASSFLVRFVPSPSFGGLPLPALNPSPLPTTALDLGVQYDQVVAIRDVAGQRELGFHPNGLGLVNDVSNLDVRFWPATGPQPSGVQIRAGSDVRVQVGASEWLQRHPTAGSAWLTATESEASVFRLAVASGIVGPDPDALELVFDGAGGGAAAREWLATPSDGSGTAFFSTDAEQKISFGLRLKSSAPSQVRVATNVKYGQDFVLSSAAGMRFTFSEFCPGEFGWRPTADANDPIVLRVMGATGETNRTGTVYVGEPVRVFAPNFGSFLNETVWFAFNPDEATPMQFLSSNTDFLALESVGSGARLGMDPGKNLASLNTDEALWTSVKLEEPPLGAGISGSAQPAPAASLTSRVLPGVQVVYGMPYNVIRVGHDRKSDLQLGSGLGHGIQWVEVGLGHPLEISPFDGFGDVVHGNKVRITHSFTENQIYGEASAGAGAGAGSATAAAVQWLGNSLGSLFVIEVQDPDETAGQKVTTVSLLRFRLSGSTALYLNTAADDARSCTIGTDPCFQFRVLCLRSSEATAQLRDLAEGRVNRLGERTQIRTLNPLDGTVSSRAVTATPEQRLIQYNDFYRICDIATDRELSPGPVGFNGVGFFSPSEQFSGDRQMGFTRVEHEGVFSSGDNGWIVDNLNFAKLFGVGAAVGNLFFFISASTGTKFVVESANPGEMITASTPVRFRLAFPDPTLPTNIFINQNLFSRQALMGLDDTFAYHIRVRDDDELNMPVPPLNGALAVPLRTPLSIMDWTTGSLDSERMRLTSGGGRDVHFTLPGLGAPIILFDADVDREGSIENGETVFLAHATSLQQATFAPNSTTKLVLGAPAGSGLRFRVEVDPVAVPDIGEGDTVLMGYRVRFAAIDDSNGRFLTRDPATGDAVLGTDIRYPFQIIGSGALKCALPRLLQQAPTPTQPPAAAPTPTTPPTPPASPSSGPSLGLILGVVGAVVGVTLIAVLIWYFARGPGSAAAKAAARAVARRS